MPYNYLRISLVSFWFSLLCAFGGQQPAYGKEWVTWKPIEPDSCACIWLIKTHVDPKASFRLQPKGSDVSHGVPFDIPTAKLRRYHNRSTFESILSEYEIELKIALEIGLIIHDIEINTWEKKKIKLSKEVETEMWKFLDDEQDQSKLIQQCIRFFDQIYPEIRVKSDTSEDRSRQ